jgi:hypothetical protein
MLASASTPAEIDALVHAVEADPSPWEQAVMAVLVGREWLTFDPKEHLPFQLEGGEEVQELPVAAAFEGLVEAVASAREQGLKHTTADDAYHTITQAVSSGVACRLPGGIFGWLGETQRNWEGVEVRNHWAKLGSTPAEAGMLDRYIRHR